MESGNITNRFKLLYDSSEDSFSELKEFLKLQTMYFSVDQALELANCLVSIDEVRELNMRVFK